MIRTILSCIIIFCIIITVQAQQWEPDFDAAIEKAKKENKELILVFAGSDWCVPCKKLERDVWEQSCFIDYSKEHWILYKADFPRKKANKLEKSLAEKNALLFEKFNTSKSFPSVVKIDEDGQIVGVTGYLGLSADEYVKHLISL